MKQAGADYVVHAEYRLLNALVHDTTSRSDSRVHEDLFVHEIAKSIFQAVETLSNNAIPITEASLFQAGNEIDFNVTREVVRTIVHLDTGAQSLDDILSALSDAQQKKKASDIIASLSHSIQKAGRLDSETLQEGLFELDTVLRGGVSSSLLKGLGAWADEYIVDLEERAKGRRYSYGDAHLDTFIKKGAYPGAITVVAAGTSQGKSTYILNIIDTLIEEQVPAMYVSLEMSGVDTFDRLIALRKGIPISALYANNESLYSVIDIVKKEKVELEKNKRFYFVEEPGLSIARIRSLVKEFKQRAKSDYAIVAIDLITQVQDFMTTKNVGTVANAMELAMNNLNALAKEQNVHIIAAVQFNREAENYKVGTHDDLELLRPTLANIKNSAAIGERARVVLGLFRKKFYADRYLPDAPETADMPDILEISVLKNSSGFVGSRLKYLFEGEHFKVTPLLDEEAEQLLSNQDDLNIDY